MAVGFFFSLDRGSTAPCDQTSQSISEFFEFLDRLLRMDPIPFVSAPDLEAEPSSSVILEKGGSDLPRFGEKR